MAERDVWQEREQLPVQLAWDYEHAGGIMTVALAFGHCWPSLVVSLHQHGSGLRTHGEFDEDGRLTRIQTEAFGDVVISAAVLRRPMIAALREWEAVGRQIARQILAGVPEREVTFEGLSATRALRILLGPSSGPRPPQRKRGQLREHLIAEVARAYRAAVAAGDPAPIPGIAAAFAYSQPHIRRLVGDARRPRNGRPPLLGPALRGKAGEALGGAGDVHR
jgi:hypothetical protein